MANEHQFSDEVSNKIVSETIPGSDVFERFTSGTPSRLTDQLSRFAPDVGRYIKSFVFGEIYAREGLSDQEKAVAVITTLAAMGGCEKELRTHLNTALNVGVAPERIVDTFIQMLPYAGFPRVLNALFEAQAVFEARGVKLSTVERQAPKEHTKKG